MQPSAQESFPLTEQVFYILLALNQPLHGYGIMQFVHDISNGRVQLGPGTLYGALKTLQEKQWIEPMKTVADSRKKEYIITALGKQVLLNELQRLEELLENGKTILKG
jgi:DNA-binding PadR family transcriptional regulator